MNTGRFHSLRMKDLVLDLHLGCTPEERAAPQEVRLDVELRFPSPLPAGESDELSDTICYGMLADAIRKHFSARGVEPKGERKEYMLIERVAEEAYKVVKEHARSGLVAVEARKVNPPVERLLGGAFYRVADFP